MSFDASRFVYYTYTPYGGKTSRRKRIRDWNYVDLTALANSILSAILPRDSGTITLYDRKGLALVSFTVAISVSYTVWENS